MQPIYAFVLALSVATAVTPVLIRMADILGMTDRGGGRKVHEGVTPRTGGIAIAVGTLASAVLLAPPREDLIAYYGAALILLAFGVLDDRSDLDYRLKFFGQVLAALIVTVVGGVAITEVPFIPVPALPLALALPLTVFVLVAVTNAINLSDGLDGLAGGVSLITIGSLILMAYQAEDLSAVTLGLAVLGATFGFLRFNTHPALLFMGDTGSQFLGFSAGVLAIVITQYSNPKLSPLVPLLLLGIPILDTLSVMVGRLSRGRSPFSPDRTHLHHRLLNLGFSQAGAVTLVYTAHFLMVTLGYFLRYSPSWVVLAVYFACCTLLLGGLWAIERMTLRQQGGQGFGQALTAASSHAPRRQLLERGALFTANLMLWLLFAGGALLTPQVETDVGVLAALLLILYLGCVKVAVRLCSLAEHLTSYVAALTIVYLLHQGTWLEGLCERCALVYFVGLALTVAIWMRLSHRRFELNSQDVLILLFAVAASILPSDQQLHEFGVIALGSLIVFYAIEVLREQPRHRWHVLGGGVIVALVILSVKGLLQ